MKDFGTDHGINHHLSGYLEGLVSIWKRKDSESHGLYAHKAGSGN